MKTMQEFERASGSVANDFKAIIADGKGKLKSAGAALADASQPMLERTRESAAAANQYVRGNPWSAVGIALAAGALVGYLAARK
jgi:ElaB/YqjD/DUF883 family membrane-anchored ribosome-binding protein